MKTQDNQVGHYFRDIYDGLISKLDEFPDNDPSPNLRECIRSVNFVRAELLARQHNLSSDILINLQELTLLQYLVDFENIAGLDKATEQYKMTIAEVVRILNLIKTEEYYHFYSYTHNTEQESISASFDSHYRDKLETSKLWKQLKDMI